MSAIRFLLTTAFGVVFGMGALEITASFDNGEKRWCFFVTPDGLAQRGAFVAETDARLHLGVPHMIVASRLDAEIIRAALHDLDRGGELADHAAPLRHGRHPPKIYTDSPPGCF